MKRFLSIDWDFFIEATMEQRCMMFPDGGNETLPTSIRDYIWDTLYRNPNLKELKVSADYRALLKICREYYGHCLVTDSHKHIFNLVMENTYPNEEFELYNIDFHHDLYNYRTGEERVNCGNWGTILLEERPNMKFFWVKRDDSDTEVIGGYEVEAEKMTMKQFNHKFNGDFSNDFEHLFMCRSSIWSPPHLDKKFVRAVKELMNHCSMDYERGIDYVRPFEIPTDLIEMSIGIDLAKGKDHTVINGNIVD